MSLVIKIKVGRSDIRRTQIDRPNSFFELQNSLKKYLNLEKDFRVLYEDDEKDLISLLDDADLKEALRQVDSSSSKILRITIKVDEKKQPKAAKEPSRCPRSRRCNNNNNNNNNSSNNCNVNPFEGLLEMARAGLPDLLNNPALRSMAEGLMSSGSVKVVTNYLCDNCNGSISGDRYNSTVHKDFDLCSVCFKSQAGEQLNDEYKFRKISALESLVECLSNGGTFDASFAEGKAEQDVPKSHHALCDKCDEPIVGIRFKCIDCKDYDECNVCQKSEKSVPHVVGHKFYEIKDTNQRTIPEDVLAARRKEVKEQEERRKKEEEDRRKKEEEEKERVSRLKPVKAVNIVKPAAPKPKPTAPPKCEERELSAFEKNLQTLESMGFTDRKKNIQILVRNRNKLFESIQELLK